MPGTLVTAVLAVALLLAAWGALLAAADRPPVPALLQALFALQALLVGQLAYALYLVSDGRRPGSALTAGGYLVLSLLLVPGGLAWSAQERSRWGSAVLAATCLTVAVVELRVADTW